MKVTIGEKHAKSGVEEMGAEPSANEQSVHESGFAHAHGAPPTDAELDGHHETLMKAEAIKADKGLMGHLGPHMAKKVAMTKPLLKRKPGTPVKSMAELKGIAKEKSMEEAKKGRRY